LKSVEPAIETVFWLELLAEVGILKANKLQDLLTEANQFSSNLFCITRDSKE